MQKHIPTKTCKPKDNLLYITSEIKKLIKKQDKAFKTRQKAQMNLQYSTPNYQTLDHKVKELKRQIQKKTRTSSLCECKQPRTWNIWTHQHTFPMHTMWMGWKTVFLYIDFDVLMDQTYINVNADIAFDTETIIYTIPLLRDFLFLT